MSAKTLLTFILFLWLIPIAIVAQEEIQMPSSGVIVDSLCVGNTYRVSSPRSDASTIGLQRSSGVRLVSIPGFKIEVHPSLCDASSRIEIYAGPNDRGTLLGRVNVDNMSDAPFTYTVNNTDAYIYYTTQGSDSCMESFFAYVDAGQGLAATATNITNYSVTLNWENSNHQPYTIHYGTAPDALTQTATASSNSYVLQGLSEGVTYYYQISYRDSRYGIVRQCPMSSFSTLCDYQPTVGTLLPYSATISWTDPDHSFWTIRYGTTRDNLDNVASSNSPSYTFNGLTPGTTYYYRISYLNMPSSAPSSCAVNQFTTSCNYSQTVGSITPYSAELTWNDADFSTWTIRYGTNRNNLNQVAEVTGSPYQFRDLNENSVYYYRITPGGSAASQNSNCTPDNFRTPCDYNKLGCIEYTNFSSCRVTCYTGSYGNPFSSVGPVDLGQNNQYSRHTVNTVRRPDPNATTRNRTLWTIPDGETESVRLGNWNNGGQGEAIRYRYYVDTLINDLLVMKYAVVLQSPGHGRGDQPRFDFSITDENGREINPSCNSATFIPGFQGSSWQRGTGICEWQDWRTIGLDLTPFHGQTIYVTVTTRDCNFSAHWGYAYFVLKCSNRRIESLHCGADVANTFKAPEGFSYSWFNSTAPSSVLSRADTLFVDRIGVYGCRMTFQGQSAGAHCEFVSYAVAGPRFPYAIFDTTCIDTINCKFRFRMSNHSVITEDDEHTLPTQYPCESYDWIIDGRERFTTTDLTYDFPYGTHTVQLVAKLSGGLCSDTLTKTIYRYPVCPVFDTFRPSICADSSYRFLDTVVRTPGAHNRVLGLFHTTVFLEVRPLGPLDTVASECDSMVWDYGTIYESCTQVRHLRTTRDCDSIRTLHATIRYSSDTIFHDTCIENVLPRAVGYTAFTDTVRDTLLHVLNTQQCDSSINYSLHVWWNIFDTFDTTLCRHFLPIDWGPFTFDHQCTQTKNLERQGMHGEDSTVTLTVFVNPDYYDYENDTLTDNDMPYSYRGRIYKQTVSNDSFHMVSVHGCDSVIFFSLWIDYHVVTCDKYLQFPNIITPNGDGHNDIFRIVNFLENDCYEHSQLIIYNRWGRPVYQMKDIESERDFWDPGEQGLPAGTYYYHFEAHGARGSINRNGVVEVIR